MAANDMNTTPRNVISPNFDCKISSETFVDDLQRDSRRSTSFFRHSREFAARTRIVFNQ
jgi:hypothetical protein